MVQLEIKDFTQENALFQFKPIYQIKRCELYLILIANLYVHQLTQVAI